MFAPYGPTRQSWSIAVTPHRHDAVLPLLKSTRGPELKS
jgi:hypothetical protein